MTSVFIFGNPDLEEDSLPLQILPELKKCITSFDFQVLDPNEDWELPDANNFETQPKLIIIDTVKGIDKVTSFTSLDQFARTPHITVHDFDLGMKLRWLAKIKKLPPFLIIGIPMGIKVCEIIEDVVLLLEKEEL